MHIHSHTSTYSTCTHRGDIEIIDFRTILITHIDCQFVFNSQHVHSSVTRCYFTIKVIRWGRLIYCDYFKIPVSREKTFFWGMYIWISNNYWYSITGQCWLSGFKFDFISIWKTKLNAIIKLFESITSLSDKRIIHFCPLLTLLPYDESVPLDSFVGMRSLMLLIQETV